MHLRLCLGLLYYRNSLCCSSRLIVNYFLPYYTFILWNSESWKGMHNCFFLIMRSHSRQNLQFWSELAHAQLWGSQVDALLNQDLNFILAHAIIVFCSLSLPFVRWELYFSTQTLWNACVFLKWWCTWHLHLTLT